MKQLQQEYKRPTSKHNPRSSEESSSTFVEESEEIKVQDVYNEEETMK